MPITQTIRHIAKIDPDRAALVEVEKRVSYGDLYRGSPPLWHAVQSLVGDKPRIAICLESALETAKLTAMLAGYPVVTLVLDPKWPLDHRERAVLTSEVNLVVTEDDELRGRFTRGLNPPKKSPRVVSLSDLHQNMRALALGARAQEPQTRRPDEEPFLLIFTSGTTDLPKGFYRTRHSWRYNIEISKKYLSAAPGVTTLAPGPISYSLTLYALIEVLGTGGTIFLQSEFDALNAGKTIVANEIERLVCVPAVLHGLIEVAKRMKTKYNSLANAIVGGANLGAATRAEFEKIAPRASLLNYYGAAEIGFIGFSRDSANILTPFEGIELRVRAGGKDATDGELGTLYVRAPSQAARYETGRDLRLVDDEGWATVNDQAYLIGEKFVLQGRAGDIAITGGHKVSLVQVDEALEEFLQPLNAVAIALPDEKRGSIVAAVIESESMPDRAAILAGLRLALPPQFVPQRLFYGAVLPRTAGGKIRRQEVKSMVLENIFQRVV